MAQTTGQVPKACGQVEISVDAWVTPVDISGSTQSVTGLDQARMYDSGYTLDGDTALIAAGKREPIEAVFSIIYTETAGEAYESARAEFEADCGDDFYFRYSPGGGDTGDRELTSGVGILVSFSYPPIDATAGGPIIGGFTVAVASLTTATHT